jgi:general secretion pathway protein K
MAISVAASGVCEMLPSRGRLGAVVKCYGGTAPRPALHGSALLAVLWLTAALSAIAFTVASTVRSETERTSTDIDAVRTYYLATAAIDRALLYIDWGPGFRNGDGSPRYFDDSMRILRFDFPSGSAQTEIIPETSKLDVNTASLPELTNLMMALGIEQGPAIAQSIFEGRKLSPGGPFTQFDRHSSFRSPHASIEEIEELLLIPGVTPDMFYGSYSPDRDGRLMPHPGLRDCLSVYGSTLLAQVDVNTAEPAVMQAIGVSPDTAAAIVASRRSAPIKNEQMASFRGDGLGGARLANVFGSVVTLRATARLRLPNGQFSDLRRSVSALVKYPPKGNPPFLILRWYDNAFSVQ